VSDFNASVFLLAIAGVSCLCVFIFKRYLIAVISGVAWGVLANYQFQLVYTSGDPDIGSLTLAFAGVCLLIALVMVTANFHILKVNKAVEPTKVDPREEWEIDDEKKQKRMRYLRRYRPKKRRPFV